MAETINIYDPRTMQKLISRMPPVHTFLKSKFFKNVNTFNTESVDVDFKKGNRKLAPFVHRRIGGKTVPNTGYTTTTYTPPYIAPDKVTTVDNILKRMAGESLYNGFSPEERAVRKMAEDYSELDEMITRREEWMCAQAIFTGQIPIIGEGLNEVIDFNFTNKETLTKKWSSKDANPLADLKRWRKKVQETGFVNCNVCIMSDDAADALTNNETFRTKLDTKAYDIATIKPRELPDGVTYIGSINELGLDLYTYNEWYLDDWTDPDNPTNKPLVPEGTVALLSTSAVYSMNYGAITIAKNKNGVDTIATYEAARVPDSWIERKPIRRFLQLNSAPLPVPHEVDSWFVAKVL
ncbi:MAG: major capsid protein [Ruminococcus sp.]|nr:major capsid protein [Ruminococcus sp.]